MRFRFQMKSYLNRSPFLKKLTITLGLSSLLTALLQTLPISHINPITFLSLNTYGISHLFLWQIITYPFVQLPMGPQIEFNFMIHLFLELTVFWSISLAIIQTTSERFYKKLVLFSILSVGFIGALTLYLSYTQSIIYGMHAIFASLFTSWAILNPEQEISFFFLVRTRVKILVAVLLLVYLFLELSHFNFFNFFLYLVAICYSWIFTVVHENRNSPLLFLQPLENKLIALFSKKRRYAKADTYATIIPLNQETKQEKAWLKKIFKNLLRR